MKKFLSIFIILLLVLSLAACGKSGSEPSSGTSSASGPAEPAVTEEPEATEEPETSNEPETPSETNTSLADYDTAFEYGFIDYALDKGLAEKNFMISPLSFRAALCLAAAGAAGETRAELIKAMGFGSEEEMSNWYTAVKASAEQFTADYEEQKKAYEDMDMGDAVSERAFSLVNSIWNNTDLSGSFTDEYKALVEKNYGAPAYEESAGTITDAVNSWCSDQTNGLIPEISKDLSKAASVLVNALYLKTAWLSAFDEYFTAEGDFTDIAGNTVKKDFMEQTGSQAYYEDEDTQLVVLPLEGDKYFVAVLGSTDDLADKLADTSYEQVHVKMPKLEIESTFDSDIMIGYLESLGVKSAFNESADFSFMCSDADWCIGDIIQKTKLKTDENGLEAAAVTAIIMTETAAEMEPREIKEFVADRPFSFYIWSGLGSDAEMLLFAGQCVE